MWLWLIINLVWIKIYPLCYSPPPPPPLNILDVDSKAFLGTRGNGGGQHQMMAEVRLLKAISPNVGSGSGKTRNGTERAERCESSHVATSNLLGTPACYGLQRSEYYLDGNTTYQGFYFSTTHQFSGQQQPLPKYPDPQPACMC